MRVESFKCALVATLIIVSLMSLALSQFTVSFSTSSYVSGSTWKQTDWVGGRENIGGQPKSDTWSDNYSGYYNGENENVKNSGEIRLENAIPNSYSWTQDSKADFDGGNKVNLDTSSFPGSVVLAGDNVTIGNTTNNAAQQPYAAFTYVQRLDPSGQYAAPSNGVIIQWRWNPMGPSNGAKLKIFRYVSGSVWTVIGESGSVNLINGMNTFSSYIPVKTGDRIGMYSGTNRTYYSDTSGYSVSRNQGEAPIYSTTSFTDHTQSRRIPIDAILKIYKYSGTLTSIVYDTQGPLTNWRIISWSGNLPPDTDITLQTRTGDTAIPDNTWSNYDWSDPVYTKSGTQITSRRARYIQYRVNFSTNDTSHTPFLDNVKITFITSGLYKPAGYVESSVYNAGIAVDWQNITWDAETPTLLGENKTVNNEPNPLVDWSQLIGENQSPLQNALTQDNVYEDIAESLRSPWWNRSWACRNPITINNENNPNSLENYQVKIDVNYDNSMFPNFDDLRFVDNDNLTQLNYWIENYTPGVKATVWVMVPKIPANASKIISMFYGNPGANPASNFSATFPDALIIDGTNKTLGDVQKYDWVEIKNSGILIMQSENILQLFARKIVVDSTSFIYAIGSGFAGGPTSRQHGRQENGWSYDGRPGTGGGTGGYASTASDGPGGGGGTYGGIGGNGGGAQGTGDQPGVGASTTFGSDNDNIVYMGSGGGAGGLSAYAPENDPWNAGGAGGGGGGAVILNAGIIVISGMVFANGGDGAAGLSTTSGTGGGGGGSGGTIIIEGKKVTITGTLSANGGTGGARSETLGGGTTGGAGGGGGGGKIKIFYDNSLDNASANESVAGGSSGGVSYEAPVAQPGTSGNIYTEKISYQEPPTSVGTKELESADRGQQTYYLNWEHRITGVSPGYDNYTLHIWGYSDGDLEDIGVYIWMSKTNSWSFIGNLPKVPGTQITFSIQPKNLDDYVVGDNISIGYSDNAGGPTRTIIHIDYISLECTGNKPYTTSANVFTRTGNTANPDISWSGWQEADNNGPVPSPNATLYIQYRVELSTLNGKISPVFKEIILDYSIIRGVHVWISPGENSGLPGEDFNYLVLIQNVGENLIDNYVLTVNDNASWSPMLNDNFFGNVAPGENRTTTLRVAVPGNAIGGTIDEITVTATAQTDNTVSGSNNCTAQATILRKFHVDISPSSQENVNGGTLAYTVSVYNTGNVPENFLLTEGDNAGWTPSLDNTWILVPNGGTGTITLSVTIPSNATGSTWDNIWVQATSKDNLAVFDNESCTGQVTISRGVSGSISPTSQSGANGSTLNYTVTVSNPGNVSDNYSLTTTDNSGWLPSVSPTSLVLGPGGSGNATLSVTVPSNAIGGTIDNITVTATSQTDNAVSASSSCTAQLSTLHAPIYINGNDNFTPANGVTSGSGTENDPYIIENWDISVQNENEIEIWNTTDYFIVRNCYLHSEIKNRNFGIVFDNVMDGIVENNIVENNDGGIYLWDSDNNLISGNTVENNYIGVYLSSSDNNQISANTVRNGYEEISIWYSENNLVSGNIVENGYDGIGIWYSENNIVSSNVGGNTFMGILSLTSDGNFFYSNYMDNNGLGIYLDNSDNNLLSNNTIENNWHLGIEISLSNNNRVLGNTFVNDGLMTGYSYHNTIENNTVNGRPLVYLEGASDRIVSDAGQVILVSCENITVESLNLSKASIGVELWKTNNSKAFNNMANNNSAGISLSYSDNNLVLNNNVDNNLYDGIDLNHSNNNIVENNTVKNNDYKGIFLVDSDYNTLTNNLVENNNVGIYLVGYYQGPENPPIPPPENNCIYHNNFIKNSTQSYDNGHNYWDNGYPSGGNYWSDCTGVDNYHGQNQNIAGGEGIGDTPYSISGGSNQDRYPLMNPWPSIIENYFDIHLVPGWNLVGFSVTNENSTPNKVFVGLAYLTEYIIYSWNAPGGPYGLQGSDQILEDNIAYWVWINHDVWVGISGTRPGTRSIILAAGWNLVSFPVTNENTTPNNVFTGLTYYTDYIMYYWNAPGGPYSLQAPDQLLNDNTGYWVWIDRDWTVTVP